MASPTTPTPFRIAIPASQLADLQTLLRLSPLPPDTPTSHDRTHGITNAWMRSAVTLWSSPTFTSTFTAHITTLNAGPPQFLAPLTDAHGHTHTLHYIYSRSPSPAATPLLLLHGWPGSYTEFTTLIRELAQTQRFHIVAPSLPGYLFSSAPPPHRQFGLADAAALLDALMAALGLRGYIAHGGDIGSYLARRLAAAPACAGIHLTMASVAFAVPARADGATPQERAMLARTAAWAASGTAYAAVHATRPNTIAHALAASPVALLAWVAEKQRDWSEQEPEVLQVLCAATLWWVTRTFASSIWAYREIFATGAAGEGPWEKPWGYSAFPKEIVNLPRRRMKEWGGSEPWYRVHDAGGHFAARECPSVLAADLVDFGESLHAGGGEKGGMRGDVEGAEMGSISPDGNDA
ncbi:Alpha/Beta hydrolase protein [Geopyxis carbonaria]|nr:Alpha/Beta hydrolase protein [Geopyxis carbonaria]